MLNYNQHIFLATLLLGISLSCCNGRPAFQSHRSVSGWCVANTGAPLDQLQAFIDYGCSATEFDCSPIKPGGACYEPNTVLGHASWILDKFYVEGVFCKEDLGFITQTNPSYESCQYP